jgi:hypothetical protein
MSAEYPAHGLVPPGWLPPAAQPVEWRTGFRAGDDRVVERYGVIAKLLAAGIEATCIRLYHDPADDGAYWVVAPDSSRCAVLTDDAEDHVTWLEGPWPFVATFRSSQGGVRTETDYSIDALLARIVAWCASPAVPRPLGLPRSARLPDLDRSRAVLVGHGGGASRPVRVPGPGELARDLAGALSSPGGGRAFRDARIEVLGPERSRAEVLDAVRRAAGEATDVLLFYYAGCGGPHEDFLHGGQTSGMAAVADLMSGSRAVRPVVILDCVDEYEARKWFIRKSMSWSTDVFKIFSLLAPPGSTFDSPDPFTATLIEGLTAGVEDGPEGLDVITLAQAITVSNFMGREPDNPIFEPYEVYVTGGKRLILGMNPAFGGQPAGAQRSPGLASYATPWWEEDSTR